MAARKKAAARKAAASSSGKKRPARASAPKRAATGGGRAKPARVIAIDGRQAAFAGLRAILAPFGKRMVVTADGPNLLSVDAGWSEGLQRDVFFGSVKRARSHVDYQLLPVAVFTDLLKGMSPALVARRTGKCGFRFTTSEPALFAELERLTAAGYDCFRKAGLA